MTILESKKNFLKVDEVKTGDVVKFVNEGEWIASRKFTNDDGTPKQQFVIKIECGEAERDMSLNSTNRNNLIAVYGKDTALWVGQTATIEIVKMAVSGQLRNVIILTA